MAEPRLPKNADARKLCETLNLAARTESKGWMAQAFISTLNVNRDGDARFGMSSKYSLHEGRHQGRWRRLKSDEMFVYLKGTPLEVHIISPTGELKRVVIGDPLADQRADGFQASMPAGHTFVTRTVDDDSYILMLCAVSPAFDAQDYCEVTQEEMIQKFPQHKDLINDFY
uniref:DUF985 domain-containing protein n=1 Tax=Plectus sambesii TaxID=2011161 RepID=A0A914X4P1_9BILA